MQTKLPKTVPAKLERELADNLIKQAELRTRADELKEMLTPFYEKSSRFRLLDVYQQMRSSPPWKLIAMELAATHFGNPAGVSKWLRKIDKDYPERPCAVTFRLRGSKE